MSMLVDVFTEQNLRPALNETAIVSLVYVISTGRGKVWSILLHVSCRKALGRFYFPHLAEQNSDLGMSLIHGVVFRNFVTDRLDGCGKVV